MTSDISRWQEPRAGAVPDSRRWGRRERTGDGRAECRCSSSWSRAACSSGSVGGTQGVATGAGPDRNIWFTMSSNHIGMINPSNPGAGVTQYAIPTANSGAGPIAAGPQSILYASDSSNALIYKIDKTTGSAAPNHSRG